MVVVDGGDVVPGGSTVAEVSVDLMVEMKEEWFGDTFDDELGDLPRGALADALVELFDDAEGRDLKVGLLVSVPPLDDEVTGKPVPMEFEVANVLPLVPEGGRDVLLICVDKSSACVLNVDRLPDEDCEEVSDAVV